MQDIAPVMDALKPPMEVYFLRGQAFEAQRAEYAYQMIDLLSKNFLPDVDTCDEEEFTDCLLESEDHQGIDLNKYDWNADIFNTQCAAQNGCGIKFDTDHDASMRDRDSF